MFWDIWTFGHDCPAINHGLLENPWFRSPWWCDWAPGRKALDPELRCFKDGLWSGPPRGPTIGELGERCRWVGSNGSNGSNQQKTWRRVADEGWRMWLHGAPSCVSKSCVSLIHPQDSPSVSGGFGDPLRRLLWSAMWAWSSRIPWWSSIWDPHGNIGWNILRPVDDWLATFSANKNDLMRKWNA